MSALLETFRAEALSRGLLSESASLDLPTVGFLVRDMPYCRATDRQPETIVREWRGTCSGKHYALEQLYQELGIPTQLYHCLHCFTADNTKHLPEELRSLIPAEGLPDIHTFLRVFLEGRWSVVDVTWPKALGALGFPVNTYWDERSDMTIAAEVREEFVVRGPAQDYKARLLEEHCGHYAEQRNAFILGLSAWLEAATTDG